MTPQEMALAERSHAALLKSLTVELFKPVPEYHWDFPEEAEPTPIKFGEKGWLLTAILEVRADHAEDCSCGGCRSTRSRTRFAEQSRCRAAEETGDSIISILGSRPVMELKSQANRPKAQASGMAFEHRPIDSDRARRAAAGAL